MWEPTDSLLQTLQSTIDGEHALSRIRSAKKYIRTDIYPDEWAKKRLASDKWTIQLGNLQAASDADNALRVNAKTCSPKDFERLYEKTLTPVVITGAMDQWRANERWSPLGVQNWPQGHRRRSRTKSTRALRRPQLPLNVYVVGPK